MNADSFGGWGTFKGLSGLFGIDYDMICIDYSLSLEIKIKSNLW